MFNEVDEFYNSWWLFILEFIISLICVTGGIIILIIIPKNLELYYLIPLFIVIILLLIFLTRIFVISLVRLYKLLPIRTHSRCRYKPTCSTYMILVLRRYGLFLGLYFGFKRIHRCKPPYGGIDLPKYLRRKRKNG